MRNLVKPNWSLSYRLWRSAKKSWFSSRWYQLWVRMTAPKPVRATDMKVITLRPIIDPTIDDETVRLDEDMDMSGWKVLPGDGPISQRIVAN